jgi:hypothetical protein
MGMPPRALGAIAAILAIGAGPDAAAAEWGAPYELIPGVPETYDEHLVSDAEGDLLFVYTTYERRGPSSAWVRTRGAGGPWSSPTRLAEVYDLSLFGTRVSDRGSALIGWERQGRRERSDWVTVYRPGRGFGRPEPVAGAARRRFSPFGTTAMGPAGHAVALYHDERGTSARPLGSRAMRLGAARRLTGPSGEIAGEGARVAVAEDGGVVAAWATYRHGRCRLYVATAPAPRGPWRVRSPFTRRACGGRPALAANRAGQAVLAWRARGGIVAATGTAARGFGPPRRLTDGGARYSAAIAGSGIATVAFAKRAGETTSLQVVTKAPGGAFGPPEELRRGRVGPGVPEVRANRAGDVAVRWNAGLTELIATRARGERSFSPPGVLTRRRTLFQPSHFTLDEQGFLLAAWYEPRRERIRAAVWRAGTPVSGRVVLGPTLCEQSPSLASSPAGHALVSWNEACGAGSPDASVWAAVRLPGEPIGAPEAISEPAPLFFCPPQSAIDSSRRGIVVWCSGGIRAVDLNP